MEPYEHRPCSGVEETIPPLASIVESFVLVPKLDDLGMLPWSGGSQGLRFCQENGTGGRREAERGPWYMTRNYLAWQNQ